MYDFLMILSVALLFKDPDPVFYRVRIRNTAKKVCLIWIHPTAASPDVSLSKADVDGAFLYDPGSSNGIKKRGVRLKKNIRLDHRIIRNIFF